MTMNDFWTKAENLLLYYWIEVEPDTPLIDLARTLKRMGYFENRTADAVAQHIGKLKKIPISVPDPVHTF